jgi:hypothetical protein
MLEFVGRFCGQPTSKPFNQFLELLHVASLSQMKNGRLFNLP